MTKRNVLHLSLAVGLGVSYALYHLSRGAGAGAWIAGIFAALVGGFIVQAWQPPSGGRGSGQNPTADS